MLLAVGELSALPRVGIGGMMLETGAVEQPAIRHKAMNVGNGFINSSVRGHGEM